MNPRIILSPKDKAALEATRALLLADAAREMQFRQGQLLTCSERDRPPHPAVVEAYELARDRFVKLVRGKVTA